MKRWIVRIVDGAERIVFGFLWVWFWFVPALLVVAWLMREPAAVWRLLPFGAFAALVAWKRRREAGAGGGLMKRLFVMPALLLALLLLAVPDAVWLLLLFGAFAALVVWLLARARARREADRDWARLLTEADREVLPEWAGCECGDPGCAVCGDPDLGPADPVRRVEIDAARREAEGAG